MPLVLASLLGGLIQIAATVAGRVVLALGFSLVIYTGMSTTLDWLKGQAMVAITGLPADAVTIAGQLQIDTCVTILFSAYAARLLLKGMTNGSIARWVTTA